MRLWKVLGRRQLAKTCRLHLVTELRDLVELMQISKKLPTKYQESKAAYEEKRTRGYVASWKGEFPWLGNDKKERVMYCKW